MDTVVTLFVIGVHYLFLMLVFRDYDNKIKDLQDKVNKLEKRN